jgi:anti-sigma-K factor RskA
VTNEHIAAEDLTLYAMRALTPEEDAVVRLHLDECASCRAELALISGDLALVAFSAEQHPLPAGARQRFMEKIASQPELPRKSRAVSIGDRRTKPNWIAWMSAAALLVVAVFLGADAWRLQQKLEAEKELTARLEASNAQAHDVLEVLTSPHAQRAVLTAPKTPPAPAGRAVYLASRGGLIFQASNLASLTENETYELWLIPAGGAAPIPAGLFRPDVGGNASVVLPPLPSGVEAKAFGVTIERAGGSVTPTAPILLSGAATVGE